MEWNEKLQRIVDYVEQHLQVTEEPIDPEEIAWIAGCSYSFFQKVFSYMNGISFAEYIRYRKLTLAGYELNRQGAKVVDISCQYGYDSPTSFTKAFQQFHGMPPSKARHAQAKLRAYPKIQVSCQREYSWKLEQLPPLRLIGKSTRISRRDGTAETKIPEFWSTCQKNGVFARLVSLDTGAPGGLFGLFEREDEDAGEWEYALMVQSNQDLPHDFHEYILPKCTWAIFDCIGAVPQAIQNGWRFLREEWLTQYPFEHAPLPELEWYSDGNPYGAEYLSQIWIPIVEKE